jgi:hypothetical protein
MLLLAQLKLAEQPEAIVVHREYGIPNQWGIFIQLTVGSGLGKMVGFGAHKKHKLAGRLGRHVVMIAAVNGMGHQRPKQPAQRQAERALIYAWIHWRVAAR